MGKGSCLRKTTLEPKLVGAGLGEHPKKIGTPYLFMQPLKLASLNLVLSLGLGVAYQKQLLRSKLAGARARSIQTIWDPLHIYATVEASNFKFGTQLGFGE